MRKLLPTLFAFVLSPVAVAFAADPAEETPLNSVIGTDSLSFGGFVDTYYQTAFNDPTIRTRDYLTQPARDKELNLNLAFLEAKLNTESVRGRVAGQVGTSVDQNYSSEPEYATRYIQEAVIGVKLAEDLWLDGGIYLSHIGLESFISRDNWAYTRLLASEFSPYYQSGAKLSYQYSPELSFQFHLLNGWQNISDFNGRTGIGTQVAYAKDSYSVSYNTYLGKEAEGLRFFNDFVAKAPITDRLEAAVVFDIGTQERESGKHHEWYTWAALLRYSATETIRLIARAEQYYDQHNVIVSTINGRSFESTGFSLGVDYEPVKRLLLRTEIRTFLSQDEVYRTKRSDNVSDSDSFLVTSLSYSF